MCGIAGVVADREIAREELGRMLGSLVHRGPDDDGYYLQDGVGIGMRRLSIIDLQTGHQPIPNEDRSVLVVCNGEIYNYQTLRRQLLGRGHSFTTKSDAEVIVHLYEDEGEKCVERLRGMFGLAIWDRRRKKLMLARDRLGIKPLFYSHLRNGVVFGSEMKAVLAFGQSPRRIDVNALNAYFTFKFIPEPYTIFQDVAKLPAGHVFVFQEGRARIRSYWDLRFSPQTRQSEAESLEETESLLRETVASHMVSDVPIGAFLSGGIDSSTIVALMSEVAEQPVQTFTIGFREPAWDESRHAQMIADHFGTCHRHEIVGTERVESILPRLVWHFDEPFGDASALPTYYVSRMARQHATVVLSGDGGDELFAGYTAYQGLRFSQLFRKLPPTLQKEVLPHMAGLLGKLVPGSHKHAAQRVARIVDQSSLALDELFLSKNCVFDGQMRERLYRGDFADSIDSPSLEYVQDCLRRAMEDDEMSRFLYLDARFHLLNDMLVKVDRMSMANSLEVRVPFLDHVLVDHVSVLPHKLKLRGFQTKYLLKRIAARWLPDAIVHRRKQGFSVPVSAWFQGDLCGYAEELLLSSDSRSCEYLERREIRRLLNMHKGGLRDLGEHVWLLLVFELWHRERADALSERVPQAGLAHV